MDRLRGSGFLFILEAFLIPEVLSAQNLRSSLIPAAGVVNTDFFQVISVGEPAVSVGFDSFVGFGFGYTIQPIDIKSPRTLLAAGSPSFLQEGTLFARSDTLLTLSSRDDLLSVGDAQGLGVSFQSVSVNGLIRHVFGNTSPAIGGVFASSFTLAQDKDGVHNLEFFAEDTKENREAAQVQTVAIDNTAPVSFLIIGEPQRSAFGLVVITTFTPITLAAFDPVINSVSSGLKEIAFKIETISGFSSNTQGFVVYISSFSLPQGTHKITFRSLDKLDNKEADKSLPVGVSILEQAALIGTEGVDCSGTSDIRGDVLSNGEVSLKGQVKIIGSVTGSSIAVSGNSIIVGSQTVQANSVSTEPLHLDSLFSLALSSDSTNLIPPEFLVSSSLVVNSGKTLVLSTGSYIVNNLVIHGQGSLKTNGSVHIFVQSSVTINGGGDLNSQGKASNLFVAQGSTETATINGGALAVFNLYAPKGALKLSGNARVGGHLLAKTVKTSGNSLLIQSGDNLPDVIQSTSTQTASASNNQKPNPGKKTASIGDGEPLADPTFKLGEVFVFPNPAREGKMPVFHIETGIAEAVFINIYDISGERIHETTLSGIPPVLNRGEGYRYAYEYALENYLPTGVYLYVINTKNNGQALRKTGRFSVVR